MLSPSAGEDTGGYGNTKIKTKKASSSSSSSSTSSSSPAPFSPSDSNLHYQTSNNNTQQKSKTMEEVWKDIASSTDHHQDLSRLHNPPSNFILQDFFSRPSRIVSAATTHGTDTIITAPPPPATVLSLNPSAPSFDFLDNSDPLIIRPTSHFHVSNAANPFENLDTSTGLPSFVKKRVQESDGSSCDRRHKRMIKNRESAARSRARKQELNCLSFYAYTNELELEVAHLLEENARLKRQQEELYLAAAAQLPKKHTLHRTSTAPF
ncbi:protein FD [Mercurialis annua]|uniref:protein FD n=1 Tax=Mercurialis annua TaxID=3986 RepID=UPI00215DE378|nr:protein FD [Mercurialis annua]